MGTLNINPVLLHKMKHSQEVHDFGFLYNWYAANNANLAPAGWHVPTQSELAALIVAGGGMYAAGGTLKEAGTTHWASPNTDATNIYGFTMLGSGNRNNTTYINRTFDGFVWASDEYNSVNGADLHLTYNSAATGSLSVNSKSMGETIRLIKNDSTNPGSLTDIDGNIYPTVKIGSQVWIAADWRCTKLRDGTSIPLVADQTAWNALTTKGYCIYP